MKRNNKFYVFSFYRFIKINNKQHIKKLIDDYIKLKSIRGTILLANEGLNASISGKLYDLENTIIKLKRILKIRKLDVKINQVSFLPFNRIKVRLKKEIVSLGKGEIDVNKNTGKKISPSKWNNIIKMPEIKLIDTRNNYEIEIGKFNGAINPGTDNFREFPKKLKDLKIKKKDKIAIYCTGGIRCEKASAYLIKNGYKDIIQLDGGILNYLNYIKQNKEKSLWRGDCFVFDNRVSVNAKLLKGKYEQCYGCRHPISKKEMNSKFYKKGIYCPKCIKTRTQEQIKKSESRQIQIQLAKKNNMYSPYKKIEI